MKTGFASGIGADRFGTEALFKGISDPMYREFDQIAWGEDDIAKAYLTGQGIVTANATGAQALRVQFLHNRLETVSFSQEDALMMKRIPKKKVPNTTVEWTDYVSYGGPGDGFLPETGSDGNFGVFSSDDNFQRQVQLMRYMGTERTVSLPAMLVQNIEKPMTAAENGATLEIIQKANLSIYDADNTLNAYAWNGIKAQIKYWVNQYPGDYSIMYDAGGAPLDKNIFEDICVVNNLLYGNGTFMYLGLQNFADLQKSLFPEVRLGEGISTGSFGTNKKEFDGPYGKVRFDYDKMLRPNQPLLADGPNATGLPRTSTSADAGALAFAVTPWTNSTPSAVTAGPGNFWQNVNLNTDTAILGTAPNVPISSGTAQNNGNQGNRLSAGTYYYAIAPVYQGLEGVAWVFGAASAGTVTSATGVAVTAGQIVQMDIDLTTPCITGLGTTYPRNIVRWRVYRYGGPGAAAPTSLSQFNLLCEIGNPTSGNARGYDNGMYIPGTGNAYLMTESKNGADGYFLAQLLPLMKRMLPHLAMAELFALLLFATPILWVPRHHVWIRNIGRAS